MLGFSCFAQSYLQTYCTPYVRLQLVGSQRTNNIIVVDWVKDIPSVSRSKGSHFLGTVVT